MAWGTSLPYLWICYMQFARAAFCEFMQWSYKTDCPKGTTEWEYSPVSVNQKEKVQSYCCSKVLKLAKLHCYAQGHKIHKDW